MSYATLMVHLQLGGSNANLLSAAGNLGERFQASVIGVAACQPMQVTYTEGYMAGDVFKRDRDERSNEMREAEAEFRAAFRGRANTLEWRSTMTVASASEWVANEARCADLVLIGVTTGSMFDVGRQVNIGSFIMQAGRPVLVMPSVAQTPLLQHAMIAWKDTRETRRAVLDALPLLQRATRVSIVEAAAKEDMADARQHVADVAAWLGRHGIAADSEAVHRSGDDAKQLDGLAQERGADLVVAGAYGHSRVREWALGGVTRNLLLHTHRCSLVSH